ncbi:MAG: glycerol-3-phosphate 1-O-acyltransferase PlsY [bacterium]|nr:MAG: glycerol-3-phosphate 1-O-acyltransferase PlsY [bacterium]
MEWLIIPLAYILGSLPSGIIVARLMGGMDPRSGGSGNIGATNVLRTLGKKAAVATLLADAAKGLIPVLIARGLLPSGSPLVYFAAGAAILGHDFSFLLRFKGGKGVATTFGTLIALSPAVALLCLGTWISVVVVTRYSSAGALTSAAMSPMFALFMARDSGFALFCLAAATLLAWLHRENIRRLLAGTESRIGEKKNT